MIHSIVLSNPHSYSCPLVSVQNGGGPHNHVSFQGCRGVSECALAYTKYVILQLLYFINIIQSVIFHLTIIDSIDISIPQIHEWYLTSFTKLETSLRRKRCTTFNRNWNPVIPHLPNTNIPKNVVHVGKGAQRSIGIGMQ